jgi:hypothetical protein
MSEIVSTPISFFDLEIEYEKPDFKVAAERAPVVQMIWDALRPWNITIDDLEIVTTGKVSEQGIRFRLPQKSSMFFLGAASCRFVRDNMGWNIAEETITIIDAAVTALLSSSSIKFSKYKTTVVIHAQPKKLPFVKILAPLVPQQMLALDNKDLKTAAMVVKWEDRKVTLDGSASLANGLFIRYERDFPADTSYQQIADRLLIDEEEIFAMLGIEAEA